MSKTTHGKGKGKEKKTAKEIAVIVFSIFIAISMMVPSIGAIINYYNYQKNQNQEVTLEQVDETFTKQIDQIQAQIKAKPDDPYLYAQLGSSYIQWANLSKFFPQNGVDTNAIVQGHLTKAIEAYDSSLAIETTEPAVAGKALALSMLNKYDEAETVLGEYLKDHPESTSGYEMLAQIFEMQDEHDKAIEAYEKVKENASDSQQDVKDKAQESIDKIKAAQKAAQQSSSENN